MPKKHRYNLDVIRAIAAMIVVLFHFNIKFEQYSVTGFHNFVFRHANGAFGQVGVAMFFLLSGFSLIYNYQENFETKKFYYKRFKRILPMYWITWVLFYIYSVFHKLRSPFWAGNPLKLLLNLFALDGWLSSCFSTYFLVGEWFTGVIIIIYALFPILRYLYFRHFNKTSVIVFVMYLLNLKYKILAFSHGYFSLPAGIALFWLGMAIYRHELFICKIKPYFFLIPFMILAIIPLPFNTLIMLEGMGILLFLTIFTATYSISNVPYPIRIICVYSYPIYLIHQRVFFFYFEKYMCEKSVSIVESAFLFCALFLFILALSAAIKRVTDQVTKMLPDGERCRIKGERGAKKISSAGSFFQRFSNYHFLFEELVKRDFKKKYKRTILGMAWSVLSPLLTLLVMRLVFTQFFGRSVPHYTTYLFCGNLVFSYFNESTSQGMTSLMSNADVFTKVNVPKYLFLFSKNVQTLINFGLTLSVFFVFCALDRITFTWKLVCLLYPIFCLVLFNIGVGLVLSALFVFFRDIQYLWGVFTMLLMYMSAIFYTIDGYSAIVRNIFLINPVYLFIRYFRKIVIEATIPTVWFHLLMLADVVIVLTIGCWIYKKYNTRFLYYV